MNKLLKLSCLSLFLLMAASVSSASLKDYRYETVSNDPLKARIYTLDNLYDRQQRTTTHTDVYRRTCRW